MMNSPNLTFLTFADFSAALSAVNSLPSGHDVLEFGQQQGGDYIVLLSSAKNILVDIKTPTADSLFLENAHADLLPGYFKMKKTKVVKNLLVLEGFKLGDLFFSANHLLKNTDYQIIEIQRNPLPGGKAVAIFANGTQPHIGSLRTTVSARLIDTLTPAVAQFFNIG